MPAEVYNLMVQAWSRVGPAILANEDELRARLARRRSRHYARPPRPFCAAVRANDLRITPLNTIIWPKYALDPASPAAHHLKLDSQLLKDLSRPVNIPPPGMDATQAAPLLGISTNGIYTMIKDGRLIARYIPHLGGKRGKPVPLVHTRGNLDPCASRNHRLGPGRLWDEIWHELPLHIPNGLEFELNRIPKYRTTRKRQIFTGWRWLCPACKRPARSLYLPLDLPDFALTQKVPIPADELALTPARPQTPACVKCHRIYDYSANSAYNLTLCWNHAILHLSSGLLYGHEVSHPSWLKIAPAKTRRYLERDPDHEAHEADRLKRERFTREFDRQPIWINGKLNPIFNQ